MHTILTKRALNWVLALAAAVLSIVLLGSMGRAMADNGTANDNRHMVTVYDRGTEQTIITRAHTVRQALDQAHIALDRADLVEPGLDETVVSDHFNINVYRARPVVVEDGQERIRTTTAEQSPAKIAQAAKVTLYPEDKTSLTRVDDVVEDGGAGLKLHIDRATPFTLVLYGKRLEGTRTQSGTVAAFLKEKGIKLGPKDGTSAPVTTPITAGMTLEIWRDGVQTVTQEEDVPMPTQQVQDQDHPIGFKEVRTPGKPGKKQVTYEIDMKNGKEVSRKAIQEVQTTPAVTQIEAVGVKVVLPAGSHEDWMAAAGISASDYGYVNYIVSHEGGWEPCKVQGGAIDCSYAANGGAMGYGVVQATPGNKMASAGPDWATNPITQLKWASGYAVGRYGSWQAAYNHWLSSHNW